MQVSQIKKAAERVSKQYGMPSPVVSKIIGRCGDRQVEVRSELTLEDGGLEMMEAINKIDSEYICEPQGGCVYIVYKPL